MGNGSSGDGSRPVDIEKMMAQPREWATLVSLFATQYRLAIRDTLAWSQRTSDARARAELDKLHSRSLLYADVFESLGGVPEGQPESKIAQCYETAYSGNDPISCLAFNLMLDTLATVVLASIRVPEEGKLRRFIVEAGQDCADRCRFQEDRLIERIAGSPDVQKRARRYMVQHLAALLDALVFYEQDLSALGFDFQGILADWIRRLREAMGRMNLLLDDDRSGGSPAARTMPAARTDRREAQRR